MQSKILLVLLALFAFAVALPYQQQIALVNSLQVGRDDDPNQWTCVGCDQTNQPLKTFIIQNKKDQVKSIISVYEEYTVLAFRYTANAKNIWQDVLWAVQTQDEHAPTGCKVQKAYDGMWNSIRTDVIKALRQNVHTRRLIISGISLGGGLAVISYVDIRATKEFDNVQIITFGAPRVGNKKWAAWFDSITPSTRIYITEDPIAFLPRCLTLVCNYGQTGTPYICYPSKAQCVKSSSSVDQKIPGKAILTNLVSEVIQHKDEVSNGQLGGIVDHIYGYKQLRDYTLVQ